MSDKDQKFPIDLELEAPLKKVRYPGFDMDILAMQLVTEAHLSEGKAVIHLRPVSAPPEVREELENQIATVVREATGVQEVEVHSPEPPEPKKEEKGPHAIDGVKWVVPVASGKGGVGKSTVAVNLAMALSSMGLKVGILDLDLYGPSVPMMLGVTGAQPDAVGQQIAPILAHGLKAMSVGFLIKADTALIWRGPLVMKAVRQLLHDVAWAPLDVLILDLPPGTGDVQISMAQEVPITGAVVVTTPQDVALTDAIKGVDMFRQVGAPLMGIVENMSYFNCPDCGSRHEIFGHGSVKPLCEKLGVPYLGEIPLDPSLRQLADLGQPKTVLESPAGEPYRELAKMVLAQLKSQD
ncbi:MAG: Mrp/NBP35 family ATP-binding protein [Desulfarculaceae bacterium]|nr:Mrp/NBP35 family ATP-binding protein [Desulfarculaceae bacterium]MCF8047568.1 Mrp/NBP35 family ATP-binding protein [Desulfarculaceae bacterium]MCF8063845.1 Mrp/NBP35 family ATP-binding protein [Desulfarculaceae bacterium]MCF8099426.1 Mrp/NBP35 family ATP-binding protein [Desulfarculaceae bacterium]MCF8122596.1 Mrp/NBP35 family ATP-binding protein [Desulfarculaceae bacterium]